MPGIALVALALVAVVWTEVAARGASVVRSPGPARIVEGDAYPLRLELRTGPLPPPGGELDDPLLDHPVAIGPLRTERGSSSTCGCPGGDAVALGGGTWTIRDPLGLHSRRVAARPPASC